MTFWMARAACRGADTELFFPIDEEKGAGEAKAICAACPVREACLEFALQTRSVDGIYAGTTGTERKAMLRKGRKPAPKAA